MRAKVLTIAASVVVGLLVAGAVDAAPKAGPGSSGARGASSFGQPASGAARSVARSATLITSAGALRGQRSLLTGASSQASPKVTEIIRDRERNGPGWLGVAFLASLLSRSDLSSADRGWIESRIASLREAGEDGPAAAPLLASVDAPVRFTYVGLRPQYDAGKKVVMVVQASKAGSVVPVACELEGASQTDPAPASTKVQVTWTPEWPGVRILSCEAGGHFARKLLHVVAAVPPGTVSSMEVK